MKGFVAILNLSNVITLGKGDQAEFFGNEEPIALGKVFDTQAEAQAYGESVAVNLLERGNIESSPWDGEASVIVTVGVKFYRPVKESK